MTNMLLNASLGFTLFFLFGWLSLAIWLLFIRRLVQMLHHIPRLDPQSTHKQPVAGISVIVAAKDEQHNIEPCLRSILKQDYLDFEIILVNDRSVDATLQIAEKLAQAFPGKLRCHTIRHVPDGWGGQNHALHQGAQMAQKPWICFTDADCRFESPSLLSSAYIHARDHRIDFLSVLPELYLDHFWEKLYLPISGLMLTSQLHLDQVNQSRTNTAYANGAFMLLDKSCYQRLGGHESVRQIVNDDIALAKRAKQHGYNTGLTSNDAMLRCHLYGGPMASWRGWLRNFQGTMPANKLFSAALLVFILFVLPWIGWSTVFFNMLWNHTQTIWLIGGVPWLAVVVLSHLVLWRVYRAYPASQAWSLLHWPGAVFVMSVLLVAAIKSWRKYKISWHGIDYPAL